MLHALRHLDVRHTCVYPTDKLPRVWTRSTANVANPDDHDRTGQHWDVFYADECGTGSYFVSYGIPPLDSRFLLRLRQNSTVHHWNTSQLQGIHSETCGQYCWVILYFMRNAYNHRQFLNLFTDDFERNDRLIVKLFHKFFCVIKEKV